MSTVKQNCRKRPRPSGSCDDSSDSEVDIVSVKQRKINGTQGYYMPFINHLKNIFCWVRGLPVKQFFSSAVEMGSAQDLVLIDEDEECSAAAVKKDSNFKTKRKSTNNRPFHNSLTFPNTFVTLKSKNKKSSNNGNSDASEACLSRTNGHNPFKDIILDPDGTTSTTDIIANSHKLSRLSLRSTPKDQDSKNAIKFDRGLKLLGTRSILSDSSYKQTPQPFIKQSVDTTSDIEILFDTRNVQLDDVPAAPEADEIEIVSEIASPKSSHFLSRHQHKQRFSFPKRSSLSNHSKVSLVHKSPEQPKLSTPFTAHEVVRLQERDRYQRLLEQYANGPFYQPIIKKPSPEAKIQVDLTDEDRPSAFMKETLSQPVNSFLEKYLKPCQLVTSTEAGSSSLNSKGESKSEVSEDDDEPFILQMKLPKLKPLPSSNAGLFTAQWLSDLKITVSEETRERMKVVEQHEQQLAEIQKTREALRAAERRKHDHLRIKGAVLPETVNVEDEDFFELTPEMEKAIDNALIPFPQNELLCSLKGQCQIMRKDMDTLSGLNWLNDEIINYYITLIVERSTADNYPSVHAFNSFFYSTLKQKGYSAVRRWTRKVDIFSFDINLVPLHLGVHWCLAVIDHRHKKLQYYDSMGGSEESCLEVLRDYLVQEKKDKKGETLDVLSWTMEVMKDIPHQMNGSDCGMFTLKYAEYITRNAKITFTQKNMEYFRRRMVYEILEKRLL